MKDRLNGMKIAILVTDGFERVELARPRDALDWAVASRTPDDIPAFNGAMIGLFARQSAVAA